MSDEASAVSEVTVQPRNGIKVYEPKCSVILKKTIGRSTTGAGGSAVSERFKGAAREMDLTPFLGEAGGVTVTQVVRNPGTGMFSVTFADKMNTEQQESLYGLIEPMDIVEIRMARDPSLYSGGELPIIMRGFVSKVRRTRAMGEDGRPYRTVTISGQNYGKILQLLRLEYRFGQILGLNLVTAFKLAENYGINAVAYDDAAVFIGEMVDKLINTGTPETPGFLAQLREKAAPGAESPVLDIATELTSGLGGSVQPFGAQDWGGGSIYELMSTFGDVGPWNELFVEDREDGPWLVYRPTPFKDLQGKYIQDVDTPVETVAIAASDIMTDDVERSDENVANCFFVNSPRYDLVDGTQLKAAALTDGDPSEDYVIKGDDTNASMNLYGIRVMEAQTNQGLRSDSQPEEEYRTRNDDGLSMTKDKRVILRDNNRDNVVLEEGTMMLKGNETIRAGVHLELQNSRDGTPLAEYYAYQVTHEYVPFRYYRTSVNFDRGTGFVQRVQRGRGASSPYLTEMSLGGAYGG